LEFSEDFWYSQLSSAWLAAQQVAEYRNMRKLLTTGTVVGVLMSSFLFYNLAEASFVQIYDRPSNGSITGYDSSTTCPNGTSNGYMAPWAADSTGYVTDVTLIARDTIGGSAGGNTLQIVILEGSHSPTSTVVATSEVQTYPSSGTNVPLTFNFDGTEQLTASTTYYVCFSAVSHFGSGNSMFWNQESIIVNGDTVPAAPSNSIEWTFPVSTSMSGTFQTFAWNIAGSGQATVRVNVTGSSTAEYWAPGQYTLGAVTEQSMAVFPLLPVGSYDATAYLLEASTLSTLDTATTTFTVDHFVMSTSTIVAATPVSCSFTIPFTDAEVDPCSFLWWLFVPDWNLISAMYAEARDSLTTREPIATVTSVFGTVAETSVATTTKPTIDFEWTAPGTTSTVTFAIVTTSTWAFTDTAEWQTIRNVLTAVLVVAWATGMFLAVVLLFKK